MTGRVPSFSSMTRLYSASCAGVSWLTFSPSFSADQIHENAAAVIDSVVKARPAACKGTYMKACTISSTMGPGFRLDPVALVAETRR